MDDQQGQQGQEQYDPNLIIQSAHAKLADGDLEGGQMVFQSALLTWVDDARERQGTGPADESMTEAVATLWIAYAHFLAAAKQYRSATEAYEQAVSCPVARVVGRVWLDYARFLADDRNRIKAAQNVYLRALVGGGTSGDSSSSSNEPPPPVADEQDQNLLWSEFLEMMRRSNPDLTLAALRQAVESDRDGSGGGAASSAPDAILPTNNNDAEERGGGTPPPGKRPRLTPPPIATAAADDATEGAKTEPKRTHVVTPESVREEAAALSEILQAQMFGGDPANNRNNNNNSNPLPPEVAAAWMLRDGPDPPQDPPSPPLWGPSPPKLADPTAKDLLGADLALALIRRLLEGPPPSATAASASSSGTLVLEACRGLWALHALKEKESRTAIGAFDAATAAEIDRFEGNLEARLSAVAGHESYDRVRQLNATEKGNFRDVCRRQRQNLLAQQAWEFRQLLCVQQQVLARLGVPGFDDGNGGGGGGSHHPATTVDASTLDLQSRVCSYLHSAFYLRNRIGEEPHSAMLRNQVKRLEREVAEAAAGYGANSPRLSPVAPPPPGGGSRTSPAYPGNLTPARESGIVQLPPMPQHQQPPPPPQQPVFSYAQQPPHLVQHGQQPMMIPNIPPPQQPYYGYPPQQQMQQQMQQQQLQMLQMQMQQQQQQQPGFQLPPPPGHGMPPQQQQQQQPPPTGGGYPPQQQQQQQQQHPYYRG